MKVGHIEIRSERFYDPSYCNNRNELPHPRDKPIHEQVRIFINDKSNNVVNWERMKLEKFDTSSWMLFYEKFIEDGEK